MAIISEITEVAYAKVNLALHVRSRRDDGYHELDTIFAFVDDGDYLMASDAERLSLTIDGPFGSELSNNADNLVLQAAFLLRNRYNISAGAKLRLEKRLPVASGIGGGSADAAAAARLLNRLWGIGASDIDLASLLAPLGADIPACISSRTSQGQGIGTQLLLQQSNPFSGTSILLVNPLQPVSTAKVFAGWDGQDLGALAGSNLIDTVNLGRNDLQKAAIAICPEIETILISLMCLTPDLARMSGSGATCFALFGDAQKCLAAQKYIYSNHPGYWTLVGKLR
jgi:4-diphosphocytidyl-2-C-methyl-D-erythritol kinase